MGPKKESKAVVATPEPKTPMVIPEGVKIPHDALVGFETESSFAHIQRVAQTLACSTIVPDQFRGEKNLGNVIIALDMAFRMKVNPLALMQNIQIIKGKPGWSSQWIIAAINSTGKFSPLRFDLSNPEPESEVTATITEYENGEKKTRQIKEKICNRTCIAWAVERATGERLESPPVDMIMVVKEGWFSRNGSKWRTMPGLMLRYRSAAFFGRLYAPELLMGMPTVEEIIDVRDDAAVSIPDSANTSGAAKLTAGRHDHSKKEPKPEEKKAVEEKPKEEPPKPSDAPKPEIKVVEPKSRGRDDLGFAATKMLIMLAGGDKVKAKAMLAQYSKESGFDGITSFSEMSAAQALAIYAAVVDEVKKLAA